MRVLVTGGAGFIGSAVCRRLVQQRGWRVFNLDALTYAANLASLREIKDEIGYSFLNGNICDRELVDSVFRDFLPEAVLHLAAESHVDRSITGSATFVQTNVVGTHTLLEAALRYWEGLGDVDARRRFRFLHVSTDEVYGSLGEHGLFHETMAYDPRSPYSATKAASDHLASAWYHTFGLPVLISNCSNNYGPYQFPEKLIPAMILKALNGDPLTVYGDGSNIRDWLYVDDHAEALEFIVEKGRPGETYNVGGRNERRNIEVVKAIRDLVRELAAPRQESEIVFVKDRLGHDARYAIDCTKIETELGWRARDNFETGIRRTVQWYLDRRDWWEPILKRGFKGERLGLR
ncbi:MAG: dTDP-glucose 4,6-dehydratase [Hyphomonadaceae bacterium]|nr:dTDP-glucose 4,6-dehydratase [Hyphomonadaceae bacterium]